MAEATRDEAKCEIRVLGKRHAAIDVESLCDHSDLIVGSRVAEVMINQHMSALGKEDARGVREEKPQATAQEVVDVLADADCSAGIGVTKAPESLVGPIDIAVSNPCVRETVGSAKAFLFSYWSGVFAYLSGREFKIGYAVYDET